MTSISHILAKGSCNCQV